MILRLDLKLSDMQGPKTAAFKFLTDYLRSVSFFIPYAHRLPSLEPSECNFVQIYYFPQASTIFTE